MKFGSCLWGTATLFYTADVYHTVPPSITCDLKLKLGIGVASAVRLGSVYADSVEVLVEWSFVTPASLLVTILVKLLVCFLRTCGVLTK